jgi:putative hydrolase of the HAD superfamily
MKAPRAVFFDLDATLVYLDRDVLLEKMTRVCGAMARSHGVDAADLLAQHRRLTLDLWSRAEAGTISGSEAMRENWRVALEACGCDQPDAADIAAGLYWQDRHGAIRLYDDTKATLDAMRCRLTLAAITNGPRDMQLDKLEQHACDGHFELFVASGELGYGKPDPRIFRYACTKLGVSPPEVWFVGDSLQNDVAGAKGVGMSAVWLNRDGAGRPPGGPEPDAEVATLTELLALLEAAGP